MKIALLLLLLLPVCLSIKSQNLSGLWAEKDSRGREFYLLINAITDSIYEGETMTVFHYRPDTDTVICKLTGRQNQKDGRIYFEETQVVRTTNPDVSRCFEKLKVKYTENKQGKLLRGVTDNDDDTCFSRARDIYFVLKN